MIASVDLFKLLSNEASTIQKAFVFTEVMSNFFQISGYYDSVV